MVLLDMVAMSSDFLPVKIPRNDVIVAHFRHNIRDRAAGDRDEALVRAACQRYGLRLEVGQSHDLTRHSSEAQARAERYNFIKGIGVRHGGADYRLVTAHHQDDLIETIIINLIRGTGWRGLAPMCSDQVIRPLLCFTKAEIAAYAIDRDLAWNDDITNYSPQYMRNRVRDLVTRMEPKKRRMLLELYNRQTALRNELEPAIRRLSDRLAVTEGGQIMLRRYDLIMLPPVVAIEVLRYLTNWQLTRPQLERLLLFIRTAQPYKRMEYGSTHVQVDVGRVYIC